MKIRWFAVFFSLLLCVGLVYTACGDDDDDDDDVTADTWTDPASGLNWQVKPSSNFMTWDEAKAYCDNLSLDGGGWHLPTISELRSLIRGCDVAELGGSCGVTDNCTEYDCINSPCNDCEYLEGPSSGGAYWPDEMSGEISWYWSSTPIADVGDGAWDVYFADAGVNYNPIDQRYDTARCVR